MTRRGGSRDRGTRGLLVYVAFEGVKVVLLPVLGVVLLVGISS